MPRRQLLTDEERHALLGVPHDADGLARLFTFTRSDQNLVAGRRGDANRLGFAVQGAGRFIHHDKRRFGEQCAGNGNALPLPP